MHKYGLPRCLHLAWYLWVAVLAVQLPTEEILGFRLAPADIVVVLVVIGLFYSLYKGQIIWARTSLDPYLVGLVLVFALSTAIAFASLGYLPSYTFINKDLGLLVMLASFYASALLLSSHEGVNRALKALLISTFTVNLLTILAYGAWHLLGVDTPFTDGKRIMGLLIDPNAYGGYLVVILLLQSSLLLSKEKLLPSTFMAINAVLLFMGTLLTFSRSAWVGLIVGMPAWLWLHRKRLKPSYIAVGLGVVLTSLVVIYLLYEAQFYDLALRGGSILHRVDQIRLGLAYFVKAPLWGIGVGTYPHLHPKGFIIHNTYVWLLVETGLLGFAVFAGLIYRAMKNYLVVLRADRGEWSLTMGAFSAFVAMLVFALGIEAFYQRHLWLLLALSEVLRRQTEQTSLQSEAATL